MHLPDPLDQFVSQIVDLIGRSSISVTTMEVYTG